MSKTVFQRPQDLVTHTRFDLMIKYLLGKAIARGYNTKTAIFEEAYHEHLRIWNGFKEYDNPEKNSYVRFFDIFVEILESVKQKGFDPNSKPVPVQDNFHILNGAHRTAACLVYDTPVLCQDGQVPEDGCYECSWINRFKKYNYLDKFAGLAAIEYSKFKENTYIATIMPAIGQSYDKALEILQEFGKIFYYKSIDLTHNGHLNLVSEFYESEPWVGDESNNFAGFHKHASRTFKEGFPTIAVLIEFDKHEDSIAAKKKVREHYGKGNYSIHINDDHWQTIELAQLLFNQNGVEFLNIRKFNHFQNFRNMLNNYKSMIQNQPNIDSEEYAIVASGVLTAFGLRDCKDIDYIHLDSEFSKELPNHHNHTINSHNEYGDKRKFYEDKHDLIFRPEKYFHFKGVKFLSLSEIRWMKKKRNEPKDQVDVELIDALRSGTLLN